MDTAPPARLVALREQVDAELAAFLGQALTRVADLHPALAPLTSELRDVVLGGGKRLRPLFALVGYEAAGGKDLDTAMGPALALELLHTCALLHDDIIDAASTRRNRATTHERFGTQHLEAGWGGDPAAYGRAVAILLGDLAFVLADDAFARTEVGAERARAAQWIFTALREEVMAGQYLDLLAATSGASDRDLALAIANYKSARYSVARPLQLGATLAGNAELAAALFEFGLPVGQAFQLRDDILGVFGEEAETGKSAGSDLAEGKRTLLVEESLARLPEEDRATLQSLLGKPGLTPDEAERIRELLRRSGGLAATEHEIGRLTLAAFNMLVPLRIAPGTAEVLAYLTAFVSSRRG